MNYDRIIVEMLSRIQDLEERVDALSARLNGDAADEAEKTDKADEAKASTADIRDYIEAQKRAARQSGKASLTLRASEIHNAMGLNKRYPMVCNAMRQCMGEGDAVVHETPSGYSSTLEISYSL